MDYLDDERRGFMHLRGGLSLYPAQNQAIQDLLADLFQKLPARLILLAETSGQVISFQVGGTQGEASDRDPVSLGALVAADLAASQEIARLTGDYQSFQLILRQGPHSHIFIAEAGHSLALLVQVASSVPMGWARMLILETAHRLAEILTQPPPEPTQPGSNVQPQGDLTEIVSDALDALWTGED